MRASKNPFSRSARSDCVSLALGSALAFSLASPATAQTPVPPAREDLTVGRDDARDRQPSRLSIEDEIERGPCPLADPSFAETRVTFSAVEFANLPGVPAETLTPAWREFAGREQPIATLCEVRDRAATILRDLGYLAAVQIPPQRIEAGGTARMDILAAKLVELQLRGDPGTSERLLAAHLEKLTEREWFNTHEAERHLLLLEGLPGFDVRLILRSAGGAPGEVVGDVAIMRRPVELVAGGQNFGSRSTGREGVFAALTLNGLLGQGDRTTLSYYNTIDWDEQRIARLSHELALNADGLRLGAGVLFGRTRPDLGGAPFETDSFAAEVHFSYPLVRRQSQSLFATAGFELVDQELSFGNTLLSDDKLRIVFARLDHEMADRASIRGVGGYTIREPRRRSAVSLELRQGIGGLGASSDCDPITDCLAPNVPISNFAADPSTFVARLSGDFEFRPVLPLTIAASPMAQFSGGPLLSYEQASFGNYTIGRGFDPGVALGDRAIGISLELRYGSLFPNRRDALALEPFVFFDAAKAWMDNDVLGPDPNRVLSAGGGLRGRWGDRIDFGLALAVPLERAGFQIERPDPRLLFTVTARLLPWSTRR